MPTGHAPIRAGPRGRGRGRFSPTISRVTAPPAAQLVATLRGVRALLLDIDGVLVLRGRQIPGAAEALAVVERAGVPYRLATNTSAISRMTLAAHLARAGLDIPLERIVSAASATAAYIARRHPGGRIFLISTTDARAEFSGLDLMTGEEADQPEARAAAVVIGDASDELTFATLDRAFRLIREGAALVAMHKNRWWLTKRGVTLDSGGLVVGLEYATERRAIVVGKPTKAFFLEAVRELAAETGPPGLHAADVAMVGDDLWHDVLGAQRAGLRGIFVRSGKHGDEDLARAATRARGGGRPDAVAADLGEVAAVLGR
jgi:HAD superfamily hydrolase (TIGR01458 family)